MKREFLIGLLLCAIYVMISCAATPAPSPEPQPPPVSQPAPAPDLNQPAPPPPQTPLPAPVIETYDGFYNYKMSNLEVYALVESEREGNVGIIPGASADVINRYIPAEGFKLSTNAFLVKSSGRNILIDTGTGVDGVILDKMKSRGVAPEQVDAVLLTHMHGDHIGSLQKDGRPVFTNAKVYVNAKERDHFTKTAVNQAAVAALNAYGSNVVVFEPLDLGPISREILPGVRAIAAYGHTPGHTAYMVASGNSRLIIAGDFLHVGLVQFPNPGISTSFDMDPRAAANTRRQFLSFAAMTGIPIGGMHIRYPCIGKVEASGNGFRFVPVK